MHAGKGDDVLQPLQFPHNERPMRPRTRIRHIKVIPILLRRELSSRLSRDEIPILRDLALEFSALVAGRNPICDLTFFSRHAGREAVVWGELERERCLNLVVQCPGS
jgi:hypothetical protein